MSSTKASRIGASDIDVIYCYGSGFPGIRRPMFYADSVGLATVLARVREATAGGSATTGSRRFSSKSSCPRDGGFQHRRVRLKPDTTYVGVRQT